MTVQDCLQILRDVKDAAFATVDEDGLPQVRIIDVMLVEDQKLYFCTARGKDFYRELMSGGHTAVTAMNRAYQMVRLRGTVRQLEEQKEWIDRIFRENPSMEGVYPGDSRYILEPFCMEEGQVEFFDLGKTPIERESFVLGGGKEVPKGFEITEDCIGCGTCREICPQQCIREGTPYAIRQEHCLHCGLCFEKCPAQAVRKRGS